MFFRQYNDFMIVRGELTASCSATTRACTTASASASTSSSSTTTTTATTKTKVVLL